MNIDGNIYQGQLVPDSGVIAGLTRNPTEPILLVDELTVSFSMYKKAFSKSELKIIRPLTLDVYPGEILAVLGSSGSGKSLLAHAILGILPRNARVGGQIRYRGEALSKERLKMVRGRELAFIPQSIDYLDPLMRAGKQVIGIHGTKALQEAMFRRYELEDGAARMYPFQLSGGMARRVLFASAAMSDELRLVVADEPTPGLGKDLAESMMGHFREFAGRGAGVLLITHDVDLALDYADRIAVFYAGTCVEIASAEEFAAGGAMLRHPYSRAFAAALPQNEFTPILGMQPYAGELQAGCPFAPRCADKTDACICGEAPPMRELRGGGVRCIYAT